MLTSLSPPSKNKVAKLIPGQEAFSLSIKISPKRDNDSTRKRHKTTNGPSKAQSKAGLANNLVCGNDKPHIVLQSIIV